MTCKTCGLAIDVCMCKEKGKVNTFGIDVNIVKPNEDMKCYLCSKDMNSLRDQSILVPVYMKVKGKRIQVLLCLAHLEDPDEVY